MPSLPFILDSRVILYAYVSYNQVPVQSVLVAYQVDYSLGSSLLLGSGQTNATGYSMIDFTITRDVVPIVPSELRITATMDPAQQTFNDTMTIPIVKSGGGTVGGVAYPLAKEFSPSILWISYILIVVFAVGVANLNRKRNIQDRIPRFVRRVQGILVHYTGRLSKSL